MRGTAACASLITYASGSKSGGPLMSLARGSSERLKYASPALRTWTISALRLARWASATSFSTCAGDLRPSWKASTHSARYCGGPYAIGLGDGLGLAGAAVVAGSEHAHNRTISAIALACRLLICERRGHGFARWSRSSQDARARALRVHPA